MNTALFSFPPLACNAQRAETVAIINSGMLCREEMVEYGMLECSGLLISKAQRSLLEAIISFARLVTDSCRP